MAHGHMYDTVIRLQNAAIAPQQIFQGHLQTNIWGKIFNTDFYCKYYKYLNWIFDKSNIALIGPGQPGIIVSKKSQTEIG